MTSGEALRNLNALDNETRGKFNHYIAAANEIGSSTEREAKKFVGIVTACLIVGFCLTGIILCFFLGWFILFGIILIVLGIIIGVNYNKKAQEKIRRIHVDRQNLENIINANRNY